MYSKSEQTFPCLQSHDGTCENSTHPVSNEAADHTGLTLPCAYMGFGTDSKTVLAIYLMITAQEDLYFNVNLF